MENNIHEPLPSRAHKAKQPIELHISVWTVIKVVLALFAVFLVYQLRSVILILFVALLLSALIDPAADWFAKRNIPRAVSVLLIYVLLVVIVGGAAVLLIPPMLNELKELVSNFSMIWGRVGNVFVSVQEVSAEYGIQENIQRGLASVEAGIGRFVGNALGTISGFFGGLVSFVITLVLTFYIVVEEDAVKRLARAIAPSEYHAYLSGLVSRIQQKIGAWLRGELILMLIVGIFSYVGLAILGVDYALILGLIAGMAEIVPYVGPIIAAIPAVIIAFTQSPIKALFVIVLYFAIQQLENHLLVPKVMQRAVGLNPVVSIVALMVGATLGGVLGAILAIPVATALSVVIEDFFKKENETVEK